MPQVTRLFDSLFSLPAFQAACRVIKEGEVRPERIALSGLTRTASALLAAGLLHKTSHPIVLITQDNESAERLSSAAASLLDWIEPGLGRCAGSLPAFDASPYENRSPHPEILGRRAVTLRSMAQGDVRLLCAPAAAALGRFRSAEGYRSLAVELKAGEELDRDDLAQHLAACGYERAEPVAEIGQFSVRGGIVDVFSSNASWPFRIEFSGDLIESIREFDPATQRSLAPVSSALLLPLRELPETPEFFRKLAHALLERAPGRKAREQEWLPQCAAAFPGWEFYGALGEPHPNSLFTLFERPAVLWDGPLARREQMRLLRERWRSEFDEIRDALPPRPRPEELFLGEEDFEQAVRGLPQIEMDELVIEPAQRDEDAALSDSGASQSSDAASVAGDSVRVEIARPTEIYQLLSQPAPKFRGSVKALAEDLKKRLERRESVILVFPAPSKAERLLEVLSDSGIPFEMMSAGDGAEHAAGSFLSAGFARVVIAGGRIAEGVVFPEAHLALISELDIFGDFARAATYGRREKAAASAFISDLSDLKPGDFVVHVDHGIGLYQGLRQLTVEGTLRDLMLLAYREGARLYVPLERLDLVEKYRSASEDAKPELDRLGGTSWARTKQRVQKALRDLAQDLLRLYAERKMLGGVAAGPDTPWQKEFEEAFPFEETPDQLSAIEAVKRDLESAEPMDRLLCGDVGYGKTEVAMRAAFKVVQDGRQVAVLAPTTVLAFQHDTTFRERMSAFPIRIDLLSRFRSAAEQKATVADVEAGKVDILIGTHRLLSKDLRFSDLGLLVVDEEQRFGVTAKEKLKALRANVDVLTLSATPIPRTLHMALGGLRDLSVIESPPRGRLAIHTTVAAFSPSLVQSAILQEMERRGQVYFVHNRVESIVSVAAMVQKLVPQARLGIAHGQMGERELERTMLRFVQGEFDVLVATTLIENGLDIPRANTLIVNHAERFGLADLYQLRGRVGRSDRRAYAYFLVTAEESLTPIARRRLAALKEFSDLGAGFRLAALDLELRGAGNLLGREQHGHLNAVGTDLYVRMLQRTVEELRGAPSTPEIRVTLNLGMDIKIPHHYISDERQRLKIYKRIAAVDTPEERTEIENELTDRYGPLPLSLHHLLAYALVKSRAEALLVESIERKDGQIVFRFNDQTPVTPPQLQRFLRRHKEARFRPGGALQVECAGEDDAMLVQLFGLLLELQPAE